MRKIRKNFLLALLVFCGSYLGFSQSENTFTYGIWVRKFEKGWIDSENSYFLLETIGKFKRVGPNFINLNPLCRPDKLLGENCCYDEEFNNENLLYNGDITFTNELFQTKESIKIKIGNKTIKIIKLDAGICKCSGIPMCYGASNEVAAILNYRFLKLTKEEKKSFRKNKNELIKYLEK